MSKRGLGRGLGALLSSAPAEGGETLLEIPVADISPNPNQPRKAFEQAALDELAASIRNSGVVQPVLVRRVGAAWQLVAGERRLRAARQAGLERVPAIVREASDAESLELALVENLLRENLNPMEEAEGYHRLLQEFGWTQEELARRVGKDRSSVANAVRLLKLPAPIQDDLRGGRLTMGHARALLALPDAGAQLRLREEILAQSWSVRTTEERVQRRRGAAPPTARRRSAELVALEEAIQRTLLTRVRIAGTERRGRIEIGYANAAELERLAAALGVRP